jgi:two-component system chemotaxis response regulator CheB
LVTALKRSIQPGNRIRVLVVDDSVVIRRLVTHALSEDPDIEVVGSASNGRTALARILQLNPDVITLDIEMPEMDGLEVLRAIRNQQTGPRVIMFSTLTARGAGITLEALALGADDYVAKAANVGSLEVSLASLRAEMVPKIKQFFSFSQAERAAIQQVAAPICESTRGSITRRTPRVVVVGVSTGGPVALAQAVPEFPDDFPLPILIVQHMPPLFTRLLAERLQSKTKLIVEEAAQGSSIAPGRILIAPGDFHMRVNKNGANATVTLDQGPPENSCRPAVDVLFRSAGEAYDGDVVAAILTGMGQDGTRGAETLKARGAYVIAQDEASSVVWGMPGSVVTAGLADATIPLDDIVPEIVRQVNEGKYYGDGS